MEAINKPVIEPNLGMEKVEKRTGTTHTINTNRMEEMEERISGVEGIVEGMSISVKESAKSKNFLTQNIQELWDSIKKPNLRTIGIEKGEDSQFKWPENNFNKILEQATLTSRKG